MTLFIFFINKPVTLTAYICGLLFFFMISLIGLNAFNFLMSFVCFMIPFTIWYNTYLIYYYLIDVEENNAIEGISLSKFKSLKYFFYLLWFGVFIAALGYLFMPFILFSAIIWFLYSLFLFAILQSFVKATLASEIIRQNLNIKEVSLQGLYSSVRQLLFERLIK